MNLKSGLLGVAILLACSIVRIGRSQDANELHQVKPDPTEPNRERTIYIPYSKLREIFEKEGRGVFLPYDQFQQLWNSAHEHQRPDPQPTSPVDAIITSAINEATVQKDVVQVEATLAIELIKEGWLQIPIHLKEAAIQSATIGEEAARITVAADGGYQLLIEHKSKEPTSIELKLVYARAFMKSPGRNNVAFDAPQAPVNRWRIRIPQSGVQVNIQPMIAASDATQDGPQQAAEPPLNIEQETVLLAFVGAAPQVVIDWTPKAEGATGMTALTAVQAQQEMYITEGSVRTRATLAYDISRAELSQLKIEVPGDQKIVNVFDPNVRKWDVTKEGELQVISVDLFEPARSMQSLIIELEKFVEGNSMAELKAARIRAVDVGRQRGIVVVSVDPALRAEPTLRTGLLQVDASELPKTLLSQPWTFAYRYASLPFELGISLQKIEPRISVDQLIEGYLEPELLTVDLLASYNIEEAGIFQLEFAIPLGFEVLQVVGRDAPGSRPATIETLHREGENNERLIVNLTSKAIGRFAIVVRLQRRLNDANLLTPTGTASTVALDIPQAKQAYLIRSEGCFIVHSPESLRINPTNASGLRAISFSEAYQRLPSTRDNRFPSTRPTLAFAFGEQIPHIDLNAERRKSYVTARQRMIVRLESGVARCESKIIYDILYSGVKSLRIDLPADFVADIRNTSILSPPLNSKPHNPQRGPAAVAR